MKFAYRAFDVSGKKVEQTIEAGEVAEATETLRRQGLFVVKISQASEADMARSSTLVAGSGGGQLQNVAIFMRQLYVLSSTGTPLVEALAALERQAKDPKWKAIVAGIRAKVEEGGSLAAAISAYPRQFNAICRSLVAAGESGGNLDVMLDRLASLTRKQLHVRRSIVGAMVYPCLLLLVATSVLIVLMTFVLPRFADMFHQLDTPLPMATQILLQISGIVRAYWWIALPVIGLTIFALRTALRSERGKHFIDGIAINAPQIGVLSRNFATARITRLLGTLLQARVPLMEALALTKESTTNSYYSALMARASDAVTRGESLASAFADTDLVGTAVHEAMRSGERSGQLGPLLNTIADFLDEENEVTLRSLSSLIEPLILIVLGVLVGFVAISMFLPMFDLTAATGAH